ncbi:VF530 family protein [Pontibacter rugosus]|uniref:VF530 family DNA-binding protein n=1 Tax=Pontibacter rugosus TaxID=1745966 RepID=A0ABW3SUS5_9BACT
MAEEQKKNPLHGKTLQMILEHLVEVYGWEQLSTKININCFKSNPSIKSSLTFLRRTPWAREKVESLYLYTLRKFR